MLGVGADGIDEAVMALDLPDWSEGVHIPDFDDASSAGAQHHGAAGDEGQGTDPVFVGIGDLLEAQSTAMSNLICSTTGSLMHPCWVAGSSLSQGAQLLSDTPGLTGTGELVVPR